MSRYEHLKGWKYSFIKSCLSVIHMCTDNILETSSFQSIIRILSDLREYIMIWICRSALELWTEVDEDIAAHGGEKMIKEPKNWNQSLVFGEGYCLYIMSFVSFVMWHDSTKQNTDIKGGISHMFYQVWHAFLVTKVTVLKSPDSWGFPKLKISFRMFFWEIFCDLSWSHIVILSTWLA